MAAFELISVNIIPIGIILGLLDPVLSIPSASVIFRPVVSACLLKPSTHLTSFIVALLFMALRCVALISSYFSYACVAPLDILFQCYDEFLPLLMHATTIMIPVNIFSNK